MKENNEQLTKPLAELKKQDFKEDFKLDFITKEEHQYLIKILENEQ